MRKIREFNLRLPFKEIRLRARRAVDLEALGLGDAELQDLIDRVAKTLHPAVVFVSYGPESEETAKLSPIPGLAHTIAAATLGADVTPLLDEMRTESKERGKVYDIVADTAMERAVRFVVNLLKEEASDERCELSPIHYLESSEELELVLSKLGADRIGVSVEAGQSSPLYTKVFCLSWIAQKRKKGKKVKSRASSRK